MRKVDLAGIYLAFAVACEDMLHSQSDRLGDEGIDLNRGSLIKKKKRIPTGCKKFIIGKYEVIALNRRNAIRKALKLRSNDFNRS